MSRRAVLGAALLALLVPASSWAVFHLARVNEVMSGVGGDANVQYVEVRILDGGTFPQNSVASTRLTWFNCNFTACKVLMQVPFNVANGGTGLTWLMGSPSDAMFLAATGIHAEFYWDNATIGNIDPTCGMVCWGAPGLSAPPPTAWDPGEPNSYTDCVAYGGYTGRTKTLASYAGGPTSGTPTGLAPGNGMTMSLTRVSDTNNNLNDFSLAAMSPTNNGAGNPANGTQAPDPCPQAANNCPCTPATTTTTSTLPPPQDTVETNIFLVKNPSDPSARKVLWLVKEAAPNDDMVNGDPVTSGSTLNLKLDANTQCFHMPSSGWSNVDGIGFKYADPMGVLGEGLVKKAQIKRTPGGVFQIKVIISGKNGAVNIVPPNPGTQGDMNFHINVGHQYCGSTAGGMLNPNDAVTFKAKGAPAPASCNLTFCP